MPETTYQFTYQDGHSDNIIICTNENNDIDTPDTFSPPDWARLDYHQCRNCTLKKDEHPFCPVAKNIAYLFSELSIKHSYETVTLTVITDARTYSSDTTMQRALGSMLGLIFSLSECPRTQFLKPMGMFHLPLATEMDTLTRTFAFYTLRKFFENYGKHGIFIDLEELIIDNKNLRIVNQDFTERLRSCSESDASLNAIILLDLLAQNVDFELYEEFEKLKKIFGKE